MCHVCVLLPLSRAELRIICIFTDQCLVNDAKGGRVAAHLLQGLLKQDLIRVEYLLWS